MSFLDQVAKGAEFRSSSGLANPAGWLIDSLGGIKSYSGKKVTAQNALGVTWVWAAVDLISEKVSQLPLKVYQGLDGGERVEARNHRAWRMLHDAPNPATPADRFWATVVAHRLLYGNFFLEKKATSDVLVDELWILDPAVITIEWDASSGFKRFVENQGMTNQRVLSSEQVLHGMGLSLNGVIGLSPITVNRQMIGAAMARDEFEGSFWKRGATMRGLVRHPKSLGPEGMKNLRDSMNAIYGGSGKGHGIGVLEEDAQFQPLSHTLADLQFVENQQLSATQVAVMYHIPPGRLGGMTGDHLTYATVQGNEIQLVADAIAPVTNSIAKALFNDPSIFPLQAWYPEFVLEALMKGDPGERAAFYAVMFGLKDDEGKRVMDVDEIRQKENYGPAKTPPPRPPGTPASPNGTTFTESTSVLMGKLP